MNKKLTPKEIDKIQDMCFKNPSKACAIAQIIINTCQVVSCSTFAKIEGKGKRTINYKSDKLIGINIEKRKFISINQIR